MREFIVSSGRVGAQSVGVCSAELLLSLSLERVSVARRGIETHPVTFFGHIYTEGVMLQFMAAA